MKTISNRAKRSIGVKCLYYMQHSARRWAARFANYSRQQKAKLMHVRHQRQQLPDRRGIPHDWPGILSRHRAAHNPRWQKILVEA